MGAGKPIRMAGKGVSVPRTQAKQEQAVRGAQNQNQKSGVFQQVSILGNRNQNTSTRSLEMPQNREFAYNGPDPVYDERRAKEVGPAYREAYMREINKAAQERN